MTPHQLGQFVVDELGKGLRTHAPELSDSRRVAIAHDVGTKVKRRLTGDDES